VADAPTLDEPRDNPVWHGLSGPLARFADPTVPATNPAVLRFDPEVSCFNAVERVDEPAWRAQAEFAGIGGLTLLFRDQVPHPPKGWEEQYRGPCFQFEAGDLAERPRLEFEELSPKDAPDMLELAQLTEPGPFFPRTHELGRYIGVRRGGRLLAMAGERFRVPGHVEVSAVCTHPDVRGERLGGALTLEVAWGIRERGDRAFLHVLHTNENAVRMYRKIGFDERRDIDVVVAQWHDDGRPWNAPRETDTPEAVDRLPHPEGGEP